MKRIIHLRRPSHRVLRTVRPGVLGCIAATLQVFGPSALAQSTNTNTVPFVFTSQMASNAFFHPVEFAAQVEAALTAEQKQVRDNLVAAFTHPMETEAAANAQLTPAQIAERQKAILAVTDPQLYNQLYPPPPLTDEQKAARQQAMDAITGQHVAPASASSSNPGNSK